MNDSSVLGHALVWNSGCRDLGNELRDNWDSPKRWNIIREYYAMVEPHILDGYKLSPYEIPLADYMTPIERAVWGELRCFGLPFYIQYPVGRRFVDFGDPVRKIAIEVDGAAFHTPGRDAKKNADCLAEGWRIIRISGRDALYSKYAISEVANTYGFDLPSEEEWLGRET